MRCILPAVTFNPLLRLVGTAQTLALRGEARRFHSALGRPRPAQTRLLQEAMARLRGSRYGQQHGLTDIADYADWRDRVPIVDYDALEPWIERVAAGELAVLTPEPVRAMEPTSGSSGASKLIPVTAGLLTQFQRATSAWVHDLLTARPALARTRHYWAVSPGGPRGLRTHGGVRIGLEDDTEYLGFLARAATRVMLAVPGRVSALQDMDEWRDVTASYLLTAGDLGLVSVWSPTFFTGLLDHIRDHYDRLLAGLPARRARQLASLGDFDPRRVWPSLCMVSCWTEGPSQRLLPGLRRWLGDIPIQGKGLLATEGVVSIPLLNEPRGAPMAVTSHFLELLRDDGSTCPVDEMAPGEVAQPLLTTAGGLYRYRLGDRVRMTGRIGGTPLIRFEGRHDGGVDLCGEKLSPARVAQVLRALVPNADFAMLTPTLSPSPGYVLWLEGDRLDPHRLDSALAEGHHYARCRHLGQLAPAEVRPITGAANRYLSACIAAGQRAGDVKPRALHPALDWERRFA